MRKLSVRIDADLKASFEDTLRGIGVDPTCATRNFAFQIVLEGDIPVDADYGTGGFPGGPGRLFSARRPAASAPRGEQGANADAVRT